MTLLALIPARGGSKSIPRKNIRLLAGKPLLVWTVEAACAARRVDAVIVSTEDDEIAQVARAAGAAVPFLRPAHLARDDSASIDSVLHALDHLPGHDWLLLLQPTSPLRCAGDIDAMVDACMSAGAPAAVSVCEPVHHPRWMYSLASDGTLLPYAGGPEVARRQDLPGVVALNGAMYLARVDWLRSGRRFVADGTLAYPMPPERSVDIDTPLDWDWAEFLMGRQHE